MSRLTRAVFVAALIALFALVPTGHADVLYQFSTENAGGDQYVASLVSIDAVDPNVATPEPLKVAPPNP